MAMKLVVALSSFVIGGTEHGLVLSPGMHGRRPVQCVKGEQFEIDDGDARYHVVASACV